MKYFLKAWEFLLSFMFMVMKLRILKKQGNFSYWATVSSSLTVIPDSGQLWCYNTTETYQ